MPASECPFCHGTLASAGKVRYCPQCGWHKQEATAQLRLSMRMFPFAYVASLGFTYFFFRTLTHSRDLNIALAILLPAFAFALGFLFTRLSLTKVEGAPDFAGRPAPDSPKPSATAQNSRNPINESEAAASDQALFKISRPREVRWNARGKKKMTLAVVYFAICGGLVSFSLYQEWSRTHSLADFGVNQLVLAAVVAMVMGLMASTWRTTARDRDLLENGELVLARVIKKWTVRNGETIYCEYQEAQGQWRKVSALDNSHSLEVGMVTPVFYDPANPKRQIIYRTARADVVTSN